VQDILTSMRIKVSPEPMRVRMAPSAKELEACADFGRKFAGIAGGDAA
jgi:flavorubredoxin